jgi:hypothetical protein
VFRVDASQFEQRFDSSFGPGDRLAEPFVLAYDPSRPLAPADRLAGLDRYVEGGADGLGEAQGYGFRFDAFTFRANASAQPFKYARLGRYWSERRVGARSTYDLFQVFGFAAEASEMPTSGTARYTGGAAGVFTSFQEGEFDWLARAELSADFASNSLQG